MLSMTEKRNENNPTVIVAGKLKDGKQGFEGAKAKRHEFAKRLSNRSRVALAAKWSGVGSILPTHSS